MPDFTVTRGDTIALDLVVSAAGLPYSLVGRTIWFTGKYSYADPDSSAVFQKTIGSGIVITNALNGMFTVTINNSDTSGLGNSKVLLLYDCQIKDPSGKIYTVVSGNMIFVPDVTTSI